MAEATKEVFRFIIYEDGTFDAKIEGKEKFSGKLTTMNALMGSLAILMAGLTFDKTRS